MRIKRHAAILLVLLPSLTGSAGAESPTSECRGETTKPAILFRVSGFKQQTGIVNVWVYGSNPRDFLIRDKRLLRLKFPVPISGPMEACIALAGAGRYAIAAHHDVESNNKRDLSDGLGFSGNPRLSVLRLKPSYAQTSFSVGNSARPVDLILLYRSGLSIRAVAPQAR